MRSRQRVGSKGCDTGEQRPSRGSLSRYGRWGFAVMGLAGLALALAPAGASATPARYVYEMCDSALPGGGVAGVLHTQSGGQPWDLVDNCNEPGGSLAIRQTGEITGAGGSATWGAPIKAPPGGSMESLAVSAAICGAQRGTVGSVMQPDWPPTICAEEDRSFQLNKDFDGFNIELQCDLGCPAGALIYAHYFATIEVDPVAPTLGEVEGSLLSGNVIRGYQTIGVDAHDEGGGVSNVSVSVNGLPAAQPKVPNCDVAQVNNPSVKGTVAAAVTPCPTEAEAEWNLNTQAYPFHDGSNAVQVCTSDFATLSDPNTTCSAARTITVDNSCAESQVSGGEVLDAQFTESRAETATVAYGKGAEVTGQLMTDAGDPVPGATLCVKMQTLGIEPSASPVGTVKTDANGQYAYHVAPGPDRNIIIGYRHDTSQVARSVRYYAHAESSLHVTPSKLKNGQRVHLWGQVPGPNAAGRVVVLQANVPGSKRWITFRDATTEAQGDFSSGYRFTATTRTTTYRFRALIPSQASYPWVEGTSRPVKVRVRG
ncbi:MAG: hypothetical protein WB507_01870 [Solirubrobacterales bacterium]